MFAIEADQYTYMARITNVEKPFTEMIEIIRPAEWLKAFGFRDHSTWIRKKSKLANWSITDITIVARVMHRTPLEVFEALFNESQQLPLDDIPS